MAFDANIEHTWNSQLMPSRSSNHVLSGSYVSPAAAASLMKNFPILSGRHILRALPLPALTVGTLLGSGLSLVDCTVDSLCMSGGICPVSHGLLISIWKGNRKKTKNREYGETRCIKMVWIIVMGVWWVAACRLRLRGKMQNCKRALLHYWLFTPRRRHRRSFGGLCLLGRS